MTQLHDSYVSDDEFDIVDEGLAVSELSLSPGATPAAVDGTYSTKPPSPAHATHQNPSAPNPPTERQPTTGATLGGPWDAHQLHGGNSLDDSYVSSLAYDDGDDEYKHRGLMDGIPGLRYTKSIYQKYWDKDVLIAVMG